MKNAAVSQLAGEIAAIGAKIDRVHELGAQRHPQEWIQANRAAVDAMRETDMRPDVRENKLAIATVVLRVLDATKTKSAALSEREEKVAKLIEAVKDDICSVPCGPMCCGKLRVALSALGESK